MMMIKWYVMQRYFGNKFVFQVKLYCGQSGGLSDYILRLVTTDDSGRSDCILPA
jgi:hypothetical protein